MILTLTPRTGSGQFIERAVTCDRNGFINVGRADNFNRADDDNAFFNCKVRKYFSDRL